MTHGLNLIPGSNKEFRDKDYWDKFFKIRGTKAFEWYGEYENLCYVIHKYIKLNDKVLVIGCGNSKIRYFYLINMILKLFKFRQEHEFNIRFRD